MNILLISIGFLFAIVGCIILFLLFFNPYIDHKNIVEYKIEQYTIGFIPTTRYKLLKRVKKGILRKQTCWVLCETNDCVRILLQKIQYESIKFQLSNVALHIGKDVPIAHLQKLIENELVAPKLIWESSSAGRATGS